MLYEDYLPT